MGKGHYYGGGTLIGPRSRIGRAPLRGGTDCKASSEARRIARAKEKADQRKLIRKNERLAKKLQKLWQEERGKAHFEQLTERARLRRRSVNPDRQTESALAQALRAVGLVGDDD